MKKYLHLLVIMMLLMGATLSFVHAKDDSSENETETESSMDDDSDEDEDEDEMEDESDDSGNDSESDMDESDEDDYEDDDSYEDDENEMEDEDESDVQEDANEQFCYGEWRDPEDCAKKDAKMKGWMSAHKGKFEEKWKEVKEMKPEGKKPAMNKYREAFAKKLGDRLMKFPVEKLNTIITKIDAMTEKIEANTDMDETKKEKLLAQLEALRALIQDAIDEKENSIDIESLLE